MAKLDDITIYFNNALLISQTPQSHNFQFLANYVCNIYHYYLNGYKPFKTSRITIHLNYGSNYDKPSFFGSICTLYNRIDEKKFISYTDYERKLYLLEIIHESILNAVIYEGWDKSVFENAYKNTLKSNFIFNIELSEKTKNQISIKTIIEKDLTKSYLKVRLNNNGNTKFITLLEKMNTFCTDYIFELEKKVKWFNKDQFGFEIKDSDIKICYTISQNKLESNFEKRIEEIYKSKGLNPHWPGLQND